MANQAFPVFVGSTFTDLIPYRAAAQNALLRLEAAVRGMEYLGARPETPKAECLRLVRSSKAYIGIFAMRYGSLDPETGKSLTQLEYEEAQRIRLPSLIYLLDEERQAVLPKHIDFGESAEKLQALKALLKERHVVAFITTPEDLSARVSQDLPKLAQRTGLEVRPGELSKIVESLPRIDWLDDGRFSFLRKEIGELATKFKSDDLLRECMEFILSGDRFAAVFLLARGTRMDLREATDLLMDVEKKLAAVIERGTKLLREKSSGPETANEVGPSNNGVQPTPASGRS